jgi:hypothetical protein
MISLSAAWNRYLSADTKNDSNYVWTDFDVHALIVSDGLHEFSGIVQRTRWQLISSHKTIFHRNAMIVFTECWCLLDDTRTILIRDVRVSDDYEGSIFILRCNA